jgi:hypothetical protein
VELAGEFADQGVAHFGNPTLGHGVEAQPAEFRTVRKASSPGGGDRVLVGNQGVDVVSDHAPGEVDGMLVIVPGTLRPPTGRRVAVVDVVGRDDLVESIRSALAVGRTSSV